MDLNKMSKSVYRKRSRAASHGMAGRFCIEGELVTLADIEARLGLTAWKARDALRREQQSAGPVTWEGLRR